MIPKLFESSHTYDSIWFSGEGLGDILDALEVYVEENADDGHTWELSLTYPDSGPLANEFILNRIIVAKPNNYQRRQAFRIYSVKKNINHEIEISAQHISYDLANVPVKPFSTIGASDSLIALKANMFDDISDPTQRTYGKNFTFSTDIPDPENKSSTNRTEAETEEITVEFDEPKSALAVLLDGDDSIHGKYGGDLIVDNFDVRLLQLGGEDRGVSIDYGVDLVDFDQEKNITDMTTGILPYYVRDKDIRLDIDAETEDEVKVSNATLVKNKTEYKLEPGFKYVMTITPENTGGTAHVSASSGFANTTPFSMDGFQKKFEITPSVLITVPAQTALVISDTVPNTSDHRVGMIQEISIVKNYVEPIIYGSIVSAEGSFEIPKIASVNLTSYFQDQNEEPTISQLNSKAQEYISKEDIGKPEVSLSISNANILSKDIHLYDAIEVKFLKIGVDVKSKVQKYKYDVLREMITEIEVGKTKDSAIFTLQDASRLKRGLLPPDRIKKESISGDKIKKGSIGSSQIAPSSIGSYEIAPFAVDEDTLKKKCLDTSHFSVGEDKSIFAPMPEETKPLLSNPGDYIFNKNMTLDWPGLPGKKDAFGSLISPVDYKTESIPGLGDFGFVLNDDFVLPNSLDGDDIIDGSLVGSDKISLESITGSELTKAAGQGISGSNVNYGQIRFEHLRRADGYIFPSDGDAVHSLKVNNHHVAFIASDVDVNITIPTASS